MKKNNIISIAIFVVVVGGAAAWKYWPRVVPYAECSEVYRQWAGADGVEATFVRDYHVNDTIAVDVTLLQATDSAGWDTLFTHYNLKALNYHSSYERALEEKRDIIETRPIIGSDDIMYASHYYRYIAIFHIEDYIAREIILDALVDKMFKSLNNNSKITENETGI